MVAGMVMPLDNLRAIYERLFRDGVMVAKKDKRPQTKHPEIPGVGNLQVIRAMGSLKSRGFVRETFAWRHFYWYLTNEGIIYLRDYLHLPSEIVPTPLQRVRRPAATLAIVQRAARVQAIEGPTSYVPKPGQGGTESQEALLQRQEYRRKQIGTEVERLPSEKTSRFRGRPIIDELKPNASWSRDQAQPSPSSGQDYAREMDRRVGRKTITEVCHQPPAEMRSSQSLIRKTMTNEEYKGSSEGALIKNKPKTTVSVDLPTQSTVTAITVGTVAASMPLKKAEKEKLKEEVSVKVSQEIKTSKTTRDVFLPSVTQLKATETKNVKEYPVKDEMPKVTDTTARMTEKISKSVTQEKITGNDYNTSDKKALIECLPKTMAQLTDTAATADTVTVTPSVCPNKTGKDKVKAEVSVKVSQEIITSKSAKDVSLPSKKQLAKTVKPRDNETKNVQDYPVSNEMPKVTEKISMSVMQKMTSEDCNRSDEIALVENLPKTTAQLDVTATTADTVAVTPSVLGAGKEKHIKEVSVKVSQLASTTEQGKDASLPPSTKKKKMTSVDFSKSSETGTLENVPKTAVIVDKPATTAKTIAVTASMSPNRSDQEKLEEVSVKVSQEASLNEQAKDASQPLFSKKKKEKMQKTAATKNIQEQSVKNEMPKVAEKLPVSLTSKSAVHPVELESEAKAAAELNLEKGENIKGIKDKDESIKSSATAVPPVSKKKEDTALLNIVVDTVKEIGEINLAQQTAEPSLEENASKITSVEPPVVTLAVAKNSAQKSKKKKAQKTSSTEETKDNVDAKNSKSVLLSAPKEVDIPADEICTTVVKTEVKMHKLDPSPTSEISAASADAQAKEIIIHEEINVVQERTATKESKNKVSKQEITSDQQKPPPAKPTEESKATAPNNKEAEDASKSRKKGRKKTTAAVNLSPDISPTAEIKAAEVMTAQAAIKVHPTQSPEMLVAIDSPKMPPEGMCTKESQAGAVQAEAPAHKGEAESAQPSAEKIKREVLKGKTSSSQILREAPTGQASAAASAQAGPHPEQGEPPSVAQLSAAPDTQHRGEKQKELSVSKAIELPLTTGPFSTQEIICDTQTLPEDETTMRRKIVVVEEVIEVQQIASPGAGGSPPAATPIPEIEGDDLDYDVLEELARERAVLQGTPVQEISWDHSLDEPEAKTFPNFIEGMVNFLHPSTLLL
ncbi:hypothetical protein AOLI_G00048910 [Acnodon oligacanthus]